MTDKDKSSKPLPPTSQTPATEVPEADEPGTKVARRDDLSADLLRTAQTADERVLAYQLASVARKNEMMRAASVAIAEQTEWGKALSPVARAAVARYALETGTDPVRHWYVLGSRLYDNAELYYDLVAAQEDFVRDEVQFLHDDTRLVDEERQARKALRVQFGVPEGAPGAALVTLHFQNRGPFLGVNWAGVRDKDPVGKAEPTKSAQTRAYRKAAKKAVPLWFLKHPWAERAEHAIDLGRHPPEPSRALLTPAQQAASDRIEHPSRVPVEVEERKDPGVPAAAVPSGEELQD